MDSEASANHYVCRAPGPITEALLHVTDRLGELSRFGLLDEESLTSCICGGLGVACPLMAKIHGPGTNSDGLPSGGCAVRR